MSPSKSPICIVCQRSHDEPDNTCDYEECSDCGFDHAYEPESAKRAHAEKVSTTGD